MNSEMRDLYNALKESIRSNNVHSAHGNFDTVFLFFPEELEFIDKCLELCENMDGFYEEFDNEELELNSENWTQDYLEDLQASIPGNYSKERVRLLVDINKYLRKLEGNSFVNDSSVNDYVIEDSCSKNNSEIRYVENIIVNDYNCSDNYEDKSLKNNNKEEIVQCEDNIQMIIKGTSSDKKIKKKREKNNNVNFHKAVGIIAISGTILLSLSLLRRKLQKK